MNGVGGVDRAHGPDRSDADLHDQPNVYHPVGDPRSTPAYEAFRDPAAAHGWQNAYDDTVRLDEFVLDHPREPGDPKAEDRPVAPEALDAAGRRARPTDGRRVTLGRRRARRRGALIAGGLGAAVLVGAAVAVLAGLGPSGKDEDKEDPGAPAPVGSAPADARSGDAQEVSPSAGGSSDAAATAPPGGLSDTSATPSPDATTPEPSDPTSPTPDPTTPSASPSATTTSPHGNANGNQGRGQGATKGPK
ncbi:hypothetical protein ACWD26_40530 [Streptomyces sp. NPDC002787]